MLSHLRFVLRQATRHPGFSVVATILLALGIGATTAMYSVVDATVLRPLPFAHAEELVYLRQYSPDQCPRCYELPTGNFLGLRDALAGQAALVAMRPWSPTQRSESETNVMRGSRVTADFFQVLGVDVLLGRTLGAIDTAATSAPVVVLSEDAWRARLGGRPTVLGSQLLLDGTSHTVVGVIRKDHVFPAGTQVWTVLRFDTAEVNVHSARTPWRLDVFGRVRSGSDPAQIATRVQAIERRLAETYPDAMRGWRLGVDPMGRWHSDLRPVVLLSLTGVGLLLVVVCVNLAGLLLARLSAREREFAVRLAIGARRSSVVGHVLSETFLVSLAGAALSAVVAYWLIAAIRNAIPEDIALFQPGWTRISFGVTTFALALGVAIVTALAVGLGPALRLSRGDVTSALTENLRGAGQRAARFRRILVGVEVAVSIVLLAGAMLLARSVGKMSQAQTGIRVDGMLTMVLLRGRTPADSLDLPRDFYDRLTAEIASVPGVSSAGVVTALPMNGRVNSVGYEVEGQPAANPQERPTARLQSATSGYFAAAGIPLLAGRFITPEDRPPAARVCLVNRTLVRRHFGRESGIGRGLVFGRDRCEIVGVVGDVFHTGVNDEAGAEVYMPRGFSRARGAELAVRTGGDPAAAAGAVVAAIRTFDPNVAVNRVRTMADIHHQFLSPYRMLLWVMIGFSAVALLISAIGLYGITSYSIQLRHREIGIRIALGAKARDVLRIIVLQTLRVATSGAIVGVLAALLAAQVLRFMLYGVGPADPVTLVLVIITVLVVAVLSSLVPAMRATRLDPVRALTSE